MSRLFPMLILSLSMLPAVVAAQTMRGGDYDQAPRMQGHRGTMHQQRACRSDVLRYCRDLQNEGDEAMADCLREHVRTLSPACRQSLAAGR